MSEPTAATATPQQGDAAAPAPAATPGRFTIEDLYEDRRVAKPKPGILYEVAPGRFVAMLAPTVGSERRFNEKNGPVNALGKLRAEEEAAYAKWEALPEEDKAKAKEPEFTVTPMRIREVETETAVDQMPEIFGAAAFGEGFSVEDALPEMLRIAAEDFFGLLNPTVYKAMRSLRTEMERANHARAAL